MVSHRLIVAFLLAGALALPGCKSAKERAEDHYEQAVAYLKEGDVDRATVEFKNVFDLDGSHHDARMLYADTMRKTGNLTEAYSQYQRLVEQYPDDLPALVALTQIAADSGYWDEARGFLSKAQAAQPDNAELTSLAAYIDYESNLDNLPSEKADQAVAQERALEAAGHDGLYMYRVIIDALERSGAHEAALTELKKALVSWPADRGLHGTKLNVLIAMGDVSAIEAQLIAMCDLFPAEPALRDTLVTLYINGKNLNAAEAWLRKAIDPANGDPQPRMALVRFLAKYRSAAQAVQALDGFIAGQADNAIYRAARAEYEFAAGRKDTAISEMQDILNSGPSLTDANNVRAALADMHQSMDRADLARALVDDVLAKDPTHAEAARIKATWLLDEQRNDEAISVLRAAMETHPSDARLPTLMAQAYGQSGSTELQRDMLARAAEASNYAKDESLRYASLLVDQGQTAAAEIVLLKSLRYADDRADLLRLLGKIYVSTEDWARAGDVASQMQALNDPLLADDIAAIRDAQMRGQEKTSDAMAYLDQLASKPDSPLAADIAVIRDQLKQGEISKALSYASGLHTARPDDLDVQYVYSTLQALSGNDAAAEAGLRDVVRKDPSRDTAWLSLFRLLDADKARAAEAQRLLDEALKANPGSVGLLWAQATQLELAQDYEGAIGIAETLHRTHPDDPIFLNNLASLLSDYRRDRPSLDRAALLARGLTDQDNPSMQDTRGWIRYQQDHYDEALLELKQAAKAMPGDGLVQYHLAKTYLALGMQQESARTFAQIVAKLKPDDSRPFAIAAKKELEKLKVAGFATELP